MSRHEIRICDRCKKQYDLKKSILGVRVGKFVAVQQEDVIVSEREYDLCNECSVELGEFLSFKEEEK